MSAPERRFRLILEYDGAAFHGWQWQQGVRTVEGELRAAGQRLSPTVESWGASRTDTGVHALGQCALLQLATELPAAQVGRALQALTGPDLRVRACHEAAADFHPRHSALEKRYLYRLHVAPCAPALGRQHQWWLRGPLAVEAMQAAGEHLIGKHDFAAFRNRSKDQPEGSVRTIRALTWLTQGPHVCFQVIGDGFLYKMVRNLVGSLVEVGRGHWSPGEVAEILASRERGRAGPTAPAHGLYLVEVAYPDTDRCQLAGQPLLL